jgi:hypothetical protein
VDGRVAAGAFLSTPRGRILCSDGQAEAPAGIGDGAEESAMVRSRCG